MPTPKEIDEDPDLDDDGEEDLEQFTLSPALLAAAEIDGDEDFESIPPAK